MRPSTIPEDCDEAMLLSLDSAAPAIRLGSAGDMALASGDMALASGVGVADVELLGESVVSSVTLSTGEGSMEALSEASGEPEISAVPTVDAGALSLIKVVIIRSPRSRPYFAMMAL